MTEIEFTRDTVDHQRSLFLKNKCREVAMMSSCKKLRFGAVALMGTQLLGFASNDPIPETKFWCEHGCIRLQIPSRTHSMIGGCCHAEELVMWDIMKSRPCAPEDIRNIEIFILGIGPDGKYLPKTSNEFTCIRCATQMCLMGIKAVVIWRTDFKCWVPISPAYALRQAAQYSRGLKEPENGYDPSQKLLSEV